MRNLGLLLAACLFLACGRVTSLYSDAGSGGSPGSGGAGGDVGTGGGPGSGGAGGELGTGGTVGSGGAIGSGGGTGSDGGAGAGGSGNDASADRTADAGETCLQLRDDYDVALKEARVCNPSGKLLQCQATANTSLACPGCKEHVQSTTTLDQIQARWEEMKCPSGVCPQIACAALGAGACAADSGGNGGTCTDVRLLPAQ